MTVNQWLHHATNQLLVVGVETARLDSLILVEDVLNKDRTHLLAHPETKLTLEQQKKLDELLKRRAKHEPLAYIRGKAEYYGREFIVTKDVLTPRPETEIMIDLAKSLPRLARKAFVDVGTGSGTIAITLACELHEVQVIATDVSAAALKVARQNCDKHQATVDLTETDLIKGMKLPAGTTIVANLPYVPADYPINQAAQHEPKLALFAGPDGLDFYRQLFEQLQKAHHQGYVLTEALPVQHHYLAQLARSHGYAQTNKQDFIQVFSN